MRLLIVIYLLCLLLSVYAKPNDSVDEGEELSRSCLGRGYEYVDGKCCCAVGYIFFQDRCVRCPGIGESCFGTCCNFYDNRPLSCWQGICQPCHDDNNNWICRDSFDNVLLVSSTQIAMAAALILGIIATFVLIYKLCAATNLRPLGNQSSENSRLSIGSLQVYVEERLRDAPPRYTRTAPATPAAPVYVNAGFIHDSSIPPPPYTPKEEENQQNTALHI